ncbi:MAG TPA: hypothetical protein VGD23_04900 [Sphingomicrobium sp.]
MLAVGQPADAQPVGVASAYTNLDLDRCRRLDRGEEPQSASWRCKGFAGVALFVQNGDDRYDVDAGAEDLDELWADAFDYPGRRVEWRLAGGRPFAIIYRLVSSAPDGPKQSWLIVETIAGAQPGCRVAQVPGSSPNANALARVSADRILLSRPACLKPE